MGRWCESWQGWLAGTRTIRSYHSKLHCLRTTTRLRIMATKTNKKAKRKYTKNPNRKTCVYTKKDGKRCGLSPVTGSTVCHKHGGAAKHVKESGINKRNTRAAIEEAYTKAMGNLGGQHLTPTQHLKLSLYLSYNVVAVLTRQVEQLKDITQWSENERTSHIIYRLWNEERDRYAKLAKMCIDAGIAEREIRIMEQQADVFSRVIFNILGKFDIDVDNPDVGNIVREELMMLVEQGEAV